MKFEYTNGSIIIVSALFIALVLLASDLYLVFTSYGSWNIFGEKLVMSFVAVVALTATVKGKIGIDIPYMNKVKNGNEDTINIFILIGIALSLLLNINIFEGEASSLVWLLILVLIVWNIRNAVVSNLAYRKTRNQEKSKIKIENKKQLEDSSLILSRYTPEVKHLIKQYYDSGENYSTAIVAINYMYDINISEYDYMIVGKYFTSEYNLNTKDAYIARSYLLKKPYIFVSSSVEMLFSKKLYEEDYIKFGEKVKKRIDKGQLFEEAVSDTGLGFFSYILIYLIIVAIAVAFSESWI